MKSVIRSSILLGSSTKVGKVTRDRSMPTLMAFESRFVYRLEKEYLSCEIKDAIMEPWSSSRIEVSSGSVSDGAFSSFSSSPLPVNALKWLPAWLNSPIMLQQEQGLMSPNA